jgi:hypothetical protein
MAKTESEVSRMNAPNNIPDEDRLLDVTLRGIRFLICRHGYDDGVQICIFPPDNSPMEMTIVETPTESLAIRAERTLYGLIHVNKEKAA